MPDVRLASVISCSCQDEKWPSKNLLDTSNNKPWKCVPGQKQATVLLQLGQECVLHGLDLGNSGSAMIEVLVGRSSMPDKFEVLLAAASFMTPTESRTGVNGSKVRRFTVLDLMDPVAKQKWDRVKVVCTQQFNLSVGFGLSFANFKTRDTVGDEASETPEAKVPKPTKQQSLGKFVLKKGSDDEDDTPQDFKPGAMFNKRKSMDSADLVEPSVPMTSSKNAGTVGQKPKNVQMNGEKPVDNVKKAAAKLVSDQNRDRLVEEAESKRKEDKKTTAMTALKSPVASTTSKDTVGPGRHRPNTSADIPPLSQKPGVIVPERQNQKRKEPEEAIPELPLEEVMDGVTFVLSGYQNPKRGRLRDKAQEMGARYKPDWVPGCTHLICAFAKTPKFNQVLGKGKIVSDQWIVDCHTKSKLLPWRNYSLENTSLLYLKADVPQQKSSGKDKQPAKPDAPVNRSSTPGKPVDSPSTSHKPSNAIVKSPTEPPSTNGVKTGTEAMSRSDEENMYDLSTDEEGADANEPGDDDDMGDTDDEIERIRQRSTKPKFGEGQKKDLPAPSTEKEICVIPKYKQRPNLVVQSSDDDNSRSPIPPKLNSRKRKSPLNSPSKRPKYEIGPDGLPVLPEFLENCVIFLYGDFSNSERRELKRFVIAFGGEFAEYMEETVTHVVVADAQWDDVFDETLHDFPDMKFVRSDWILTMGKEGQNVDMTPYLVVKNR